MKLKKLLTALMTVGLLAGSGSYIGAQDRETKVRGDQARFLKDSFWIYNNLDKGFEEARKTGKPLLVIFRCVPCEACAQLDEQVVEDNPSLRKLLGRFVPVRIVHANGMDLSRFQFDYDQSWAAFVLNADGTIYGRYGTRSHQTESAQDVTLAGFTASLNRALKLHENFSTVRASLAAKTGAKSEIERPELLPALKDRYSSKLDYEGKVVQSCIHCHQVGESLKEWTISKKGTLPTELIFPYPHPKVLGMIMDPETATTVKEVTDGSAAEAAGIKAGDEIESLGGQPVISTADIQWVLHRSGDAEQLPASIRRGSKTMSLSLPLAKDWREAGDISWRVSSWSLGRMVLGGMRLESMTDVEKKDLKLDDKAVGLRVKFVGQFGPHATAKKAGLQKGDVLVQVGDIAEPLNESRLFAELIRTRKAGDKLPLVILRDGKRMTFEIPIQP